MRNGGRRNARSSVKLSGVSNVLLSGKNGSMRTLVDRLEIYGGKRWRVGRGIPWTSFILKLQSRGDVTYGRRGWGVVSNVGNWSRGRTRRSRLESLEQIGTFGVAGRRARGK